MSAKDALHPRQFEQLPMFATPTEIVATHYFVDQGAGESLDSLQRRKNRESDASGLTKSVAEVGVQTPVRVFSPRDVRYNSSIADGHHRVFAALKSRPHDLVPLVHGRNL